VVDLRISRRAGKAVIDFSVNNLFDERYSEAMGLDLSYNQRNYPMPGRSFLLGVKWVI
jgi:outer membrane receptor protein involved in Fe transport